MFQFGRFPTQHYGFMLRSMVLHHGGFPIRKSADISLICSSPQLIAACHVLLRLLMPRHSPCALVRFNFWTFVLVLELLEFHKTNLLVVCEKVFPFDTNFSTLVKLYLLPNLERPILISKLISVLLSVRFYSFFFIRFSMNTVFDPFGSGWHKWTRTTDLALIRRAL